MQPCSQVGMEPNEIIELHHCFDEIPSLNQSGLRSVAPIPMGKAHPKYIVPTEVFHCGTSAVLGLTCHIPAAPDKILERNGCHLTNCWIHGILGSNPQQVDHLTLGSLMLQNQKRRRT